MEVSARVGTEGFPKVVGVSIWSDPEPARRVAREIGAAFPIVAMPGGEAYGVRGVPAAVLVGPDGRIRRRRAFLHEFPVADRQASARSRTCSQTASPRGMQRPIR